MTNYLLERIPVLICKTCGRYSDLVLVYKAIFCDFCREYTYSEEDVELLSFENPNVFLKRIVPNPKGIRVSGRWMKLSEVMKYNET